VDYGYGLTRVVGGTGAVEAAWPWLISIQHPLVPGNKHWCGGSLITAEWVLTAAHCFDRLTNLHELVVLIGTSHLTKPGPGAVARLVKKVVVHAQYDRDDFRNDIALIQLASPVQCNRFIQLACVADPTLSISELTNCWVAGWG
ncbi:ACRO protein, partial [Certhia familiaris]|nr:ACRO protein [Certhia familiaris]